MNQTTGGGLPESSPLAAPELVQPSVDEKSQTTFVDSTARSLIKPINLVRYDAPSFDSGFSADFFAKPVVVGSITWTPGTTSGFLDVFGQYFSNASVIAHARNIARWRFDIGLRIQINGTPYHYGRIAFGYRPYPETRPVCVGGSALHPTTVTQLPGGVLDPACSDTVEMVIPYHGVNDFLLSGQARPRPFGRYCQLDYVVINALNQTNFVATIQPVSITVYMWLTNCVVQLCTPLAWATPEGKDEYSKGPVERAATAVAGVGKALGAFSVLKPLARATELGATAVAAAASVLGWSAPLSLEPRIFARQTAFAPMVPASSMDTSFKLSLDPKQELSVDGRIVAGGSSDDMLISAITGRKAYLGSFTWIPANAAGTMLSSWWNSPGLTPNTGSIYTFTPVSHVAGCFGYWTGGMIYTIEVVASRFHTGRLRVSYIPTTGALVDTLDVASHSVVIDLRDVRTVDIHVPYAGPQPWRRTHPMPYPDPPAASIYGDYAAGYLRVDVVDELASTSVGDYAWINIYIKGAADLQFANPNVHELNDFAYKAAASSAVAGMAAMCESQPTLLFGPAPTNTDVAQVFFGERFASVRDLIKTYCAYSSGAVTASPVGVVMRSLLYHPKAPMPGLSIGDVSGGYNRWTYYSWMASGYFAQRGGVRWKVRVTPFGSDGTSYNHIPYVLRRAAVVEEIDGLEPTGPTAEYFSWNSHPYGSAGTLLMKSFATFPAQYFGTDEVVEIEVPMISPHRFTIAPDPANFPVASMPGILGKGCDPSAFAVVTDVSGYTAGGGFDYDTFCAGAEDASFVWYLSAPQLLRGGARADAP